MSKESERNLSDSSSDESLDLCSKTFDPLKALYSKKVKVPIPNAVQLKSLAEYTAFKHHWKMQTRMDNPQSSSSEVVVPDKDQNPQPSLKEAGDQHGPSCSKEISNINSSHSKQGTSEVELQNCGGEDQKISTSKEPYRRFLPHQEMIRAAPKAPKRNVISRMETSSAPFQRLFQAVSSDPRGRVRVVTRNEHGIHGRLEGYVVLFDKHWNLAMSDVTEVFYRPAPRRAKDYFLGEPKVVAKLGERLANLRVTERLGRGRGRGSEDGVDPPRRPGDAATTNLPDPLSLVALKDLVGGARGSGKGRGKRCREELADWPPLPKLYWRAHGKRQECVRHMDQILVRGEHVVYVQFLT